MTEYIDKGNWVECNEGLVRRGELYLSLDFLDRWDEEIERTNEGERAEEGEHLPDDPSTSLEGRTYRWMMHPAV